MRIQIAPKRNATVMSFLQAKGFAYVGKDVAANPEYMDELLNWTHGVRGTPMIVIDGEVFRGFDRGKIARALKLL
ncbi:MAG: glutaredoxin family protein [Thermaerobacter sp.]|nr:glutaredoxin family protein [Thermaerobacter sp.]